MHKLTEKNIEDRRRRSLALYKLLNNQKWKKCITSDETWFYINDCNGKSEIQYVSREEKNPEVVIYQRRESHGKGFLVWGSFSFNGKTSLHFVEHSAKINSLYYFDNLLKKFLARDANKLYPNNDFIFHQDSAPSNVSKLTTEFLNANMKFISKSTWMPKGRDAALMDFGIWGEMKRRLSRFKVWDTAQLKRALNSVWKELPQEFINNT